MDLLWPLMLLLGLEHVRIDPGNTVATPFDFYDYPITHSLLGATGWGFFLSALVFFRARDLRAAIVVGVCVISHWFLDLLTHRPDLPLAPGFDGKYGFGLWNNLPATMIVELSLFIAGILVYSKLTRHKDRVGRFGFYSLIAFLIVTWLGNFFGPPPPSELAIAIAGNATWLLVLWGYWIDKHREVLFEKN